MIQDQDIQTVRDLIAAGGPRPSEYEPLHGWFGDVMRRHRLGEIKAEDIVSLWDAFGDAFTPKTMQGFVVRKPHGYHGDFEIIDRIYTRWVSPEPHLQAWDHFFHACAAPEAVRNRKVFFHSLLDRMRDGRGSARFRILSVGCGPARDIAEYLVSADPRRFHFTCLDQDPDAIACARTLCSGYEPCAVFHVCDVVRRLPNEVYDLVWAGGLFDYFPDRVFILMLRRLIKRVSPAGQLVVGNFSPANSTRDYMEFGGWKLFHRTSDDLLALAADAGIDSLSCRVTSEPQRVNLFLQVLG